MLQGDIFDISSRVKDVDPALTISYIGNGKYQMNRGRHQVMTLSHDELDARLLERLRKNDLHRRRLEDIIYEMEQSEDALERSRARQLANTIEALTLDQYDRIAGIHHYALGGI